MPAITLPESMSGYRPQDTGLLTHATIATIAPHLRTIPAARLAEYVLDVTGSLVNGSNINRRRVLQQTAAGYVCTYFRRFAPQAPWEVVQAEFQTGHGRTDLAWRNTETGHLFFDEIKTHGRAISSLSAEVVDQAKRQGSGGIEEFDHLFRGVRVIPFGALHLTTLVRPYEARMLLEPTADDPLRYAANPEVDESRDFSDGVADSLLDARLRSGEVARAVLNGRDERALYRMTRSTGAGQHERNN